MTDELEVRHLDGLRASSEGGTPKLLGHAIVTGVATDLGVAKEIVAPAALQRALDRAPDLVALFDHDPARVLGRVSAKTLRVEQDDRGLRFEVDLPSHEAGLAESVARGDIRGASFAFSGAKDSWDDSTTPPTRTITDFKLHEISIVTFPAYLQTHVAALRSLERHQQRKETAPMSEPTITVTDLTPPVPPVVSPEHRGADVEVTHAILAPSESVRANLQARGLIRQTEFAKLDYGAVARAMVTGPRTELEKRVLAEGADGTGGITVPDITSANFIDKLRSAQVAIAAGARTVPLTSDKTTVARLLTDPAAAWRSENGTVTEQDATFDGVVFTPRSLSVITRASRELLEDSVNIEEMLTNAFIRSFAVELDRVALQGTGTPPQPRGVQNTSGITNVDFATNGALPTAATWYPKVVSTLAAVWTAPSAPTAIIMHPRTFGEQEGLLDTQNNAVRAPASVSALPQLRASSMSITETQGSSGAVCSSLLAGDFSQLWIGIRSATRIEVLRELYAGSYQYGFLVNLRVDIGVAQPAAFARLRGIL